MISEDSRQVRIWAFPARRKIKKAARSMAVCMAVFPAVLLLSLHPAHAKSRHHHGLAAAHRHSSASSRAVSDTSSAKYASIVMDAATGVILSQSAPDKRVYPASLTKMMTLLLTFDALQNGRITLRDRVPISNYAHSMLPSKLDIPAGSSLRVQDAIYAVVTKSANDVAVALGEYLGGTESGFATMMNRKARELGMSNTHYANACGLHDPSQVTTARDQAKLARALIYQYPQYYKFFSTRSFTYDGHTYPNHDHLMESYKGMDGIKTGYIVPSGFNLVSSAKRGNLRLIGVVFGGRSARSRDATMASLLDSGFARANEVMVADTITPVPGRKPVDMAAALTPSSGQAQGANWAQLAPMLQGQAMDRVIGQGDYDPAPTAAAAAPAPSKTPIIGPNAALPARQAAAPQQLASIEDQRNWAIQIGAYASRVQTDQALYTAAHTLPPSLAHGSPVIVPLKTGDSWMFRGRLSGFTKAEAAQACGYFHNCLTVSPYAN